MWMRGSPFLIKNRRFRIGSLLVIYYSLIESAWGPWRPALQNYFEDLLFYLTLKATLCFGNNAFDFKKTSVVPIGRHTRTSSE